MRLVTHMLPIAALFLLSAPSLLAQTAVDPSGHWEGAIHVPAYDQAPARDVSIAIDIEKKTKGELAGTYTQLAEAVKGLPLSTVAIEGNAVTFELKVTSGGGTFRGLVLDDGKSMSGTFITNEGGYSVPFSLARTGDARIAPAPKSALIGKELEGTWNGTLEVQGKQERLVLKMANQPDGTATGTILDIDGSGVEIPIAMTQKASNLTIDVLSVGGAFVGVLNAAGTELVGTWTQGPTALPLTFRLARP